MRFLSYVISFIVLHMLPLPSSAVLLKVSIVVIEDLVHSDTLYYPIMLFSVWQQWDKQNI